MSLNNFTKYLIFLSAAILIFGTGYKLGETKRNPLTSSFQSNSNPKNIDFSLFWDTWNRLEEKYVDKEKIDPKKMYYGAIKGMVASVDDPYTFFLTPDENKQSKADLGGKFEGIGAQLGLKNNAIIIVAPIKNSPAEKAGVRPGDIILKVDGDDSQGWTLNEAVNRIRGDKGTKVKLTLLRDKKEVNVEITRQQIYVAPVEIAYENNVAILKVNKFGDDTNSDWTKAVTDVESKWNNKEIKGLILDLRGNPGGYLQSAVYLSSEFLPYGKLIVRQEYTNGDKEDYTVERNGRLQNIPLVILIDEGSASASEIVAGALRDHKKATLIGEKSFGKGSIQEAIDLSKGAGLHVTIAKWILPGGDWINKKGIEPNIKITNEIKEGNTMTRQDDKQLDKAIEIVGK
ncbi:MAG TPA: S41 family peptidase [Candidatus Nitrosocosmicus sp.]|nr:S41 family peptidase [Candidatus Nitrosocosmicus sp.]